MMASDQFLLPRDCERPYTVTQINDGIATLIESQNTLVWVEAEISNFKRASSGHYYLRFCDDQSQVPAVMWRSVAEKLTFEPEDGMAVMAIASIRVYRKGGYYQLDIHTMQPAGIGAQYAALEKLRKKLEAEGLFDPAHKKPLPESITTLGVITAKTGAAVRDILKVVASRAPQTDVVLRSVPVQGADAPPAIVAAIEEMNQWGNADCIILGRGGGSADDLWAFNDESVVRAIFASNIPIISAVGHEIDFTLSDFVADVRAATPSAAAEIAVPDSRENKRYFDEISKRFAASIQYYFATINTTFSHLCRAPIFKTALFHISESRQQCDMLHERQLRAMARLLSAFRSQCEKNAAQLDALSPLAILSRGYSVVTNKNGVSVKDAQQLQPKETISIRFSKGKASAIVHSTND